MSVSVSAVGSTQRVARPWLALLPPILGLALYLSRWLFLYGPEGVPLLPVMLATMWGPLVCLGLLGLWWLTLGPGVWTTRLLWTVGVIVAGAGLTVAADPSTRFFFVIHGLPAAVGLVTVALVFLAHAGAASRAAVAVVLAVVAVLPWELIRIEGFTGDFSLDSALRWAPTAEERLQRYTAEEGTSTPTSPARSVQIEASAADWPGFRGAGRDGRALALDAERLQECWRRPVGPAWSSVCGVADRIFTQEQRGDEEVVACYDVRTGRPVWTYSEKARHSDPPSGPGPRATPTFHHGRLYVQGAKGALACLDAGTGKQLWRVDLTEMLEVKPPTFGFCASPLVLDGRVILQPGTKGPRLVAVDAKTGKRVWESGDGTECYASPQPAVLAGVEQVLVFTGEGLFGHDPATGKELWHYPWKAEATSQPVVQPLTLPGDRVVIGGGQVGTGLRCVQVKKSASGWSAEEVWTTTKVSPRFNDVVFHQGCLYGLDSGRLFCVDADSGEVRWKGGRYGAGQVLLAGDRLLVQAEQGHLTWLKPSPAGYPKGTRVEALTDKTWNHPAVVRGSLVVRNGKELVCFGPAGEDGGAK
jgi:outer membrane protein assembly factor BamB